MYVHIYRNLHYFLTQVRKLEFLMADALWRNCKHVITCGGIQSNHCRAVAVCARQLGIQPHLVLRTDIQVKVSFLCRSFGYTQQTNQTNRTNLVIFSYLRHTDLKAFALNVIWSMTFLFQRRGNIVVSSISSFATMLLSQSPLTLYQMTKF